MPDPARYQDQPMLRILECYTLHAIGCLEEEEEAEMEELAPKLQPLFAATGTWLQVIEHIMELPPDAQERIRGEWAKEKQLAAGKKGQLTPQAFAEQFVDANLT
ncbi:MAG: hypothetical protein ABIF71_04385 [Planctomycetota bacterium]